MRSRPNRVIAIAASGSLVMWLGIALIAQPAQGIGPLPLPTLTPLPLPSLPPLPLPTLTPLPLPSLSVLPLPSVELPTPLPSLPIPTASGTPRPSGSAEPSAPAANGGGGSASPGLSLTRPVNIDGPDPDLLLTAGAGETGPSNPSTDQGASSQTGSAPRIEWLVPSLAIAVPLVLVVALVALQVLGGGAGVHAARRLLDRVAARGSVASDPGEPAEAELIQNR